jgi:hypothetical protein
MLRNAWWLADRSPVDRTSSLCIIHTRGRARICHLNILRSRRRLGRGLCGRSWLYLDWRRCRRRWGHHSARGTVLNDRTVHRLSRRNCRTRGRVLDSKHRSFKDVRLNGDRACSQLRHRLLGRIIRRNLWSPLSLHRLRPILLKYALAQPFLS